MTLAAAAAALLMAAPVAPVAGDLPIQRSDPTGDVMIFDGGGTKPTTGQRRSIDLEWFAAKPGPDEVRFVFRIARIAAGRTFDQVVAVSFDRGRFDLQANPQRKRGTTIAGTTFCSVDVHASRRTGTVRVDVPVECVPEGSGVLRVSTYLQEKNGSGPGFSEDVLRVPGRISLQ